MRKYIYNKLKLATAASIAWEWFNNNRVRNGQGVTSAAFTAASITGAQATVAEHTHSVDLPASTLLLGKLPDDKQ